MAVLRALLFSREKEISLLITKAKKSWWQDGGVNGKRWDKIQLGIPEVILWITEGSSSENLKEQIKGPQFCKHHTEYLPILAVGVYVIFFPAELPNDQTWHTSCLLAPVREIFWNLRLGWRLRLWTFSPVEDTFSTEVFLRVVTAVQMCLALCK